jgi:hypothetical protein
LQLRNHHHNKMSYHVWSQSTQTFSIVWRSAKRS